MGRAVKFSLRRRCNRCVVKNRVSPASAENWHWSSDPDAPGGRSSDPYLGVLFASRNFPVFFAPLRQLSPTTEINDPPHHA